MFNSYTPDVLLSEEEIDLRIKALGDAISSDFQGETVVVICVLKGAFMFTSQLVRKINLPVILEFVSASSYGNKKVSSQNLKLNFEFSTTLRDKNIIIVEDIIDTGHTIKNLVEMIKVQKPKTLKVASLLKKSDKASLDFAIDYLGFEVEDKFVVGYGLDYAGRYRELPYVGVLNANN